MVAIFVEVHSRSIFVIAHHTMLKTSTHTKTRFYVYKSSVEKTELAYMKSHKMISQFTVYRIRLSAKRMRVCTECDVNWELFFPLFYGNSTAKTQSYFFMWHISMEYFTKQIFFCLGHFSSSIPRRFLLLGNKARRAFIVKMEICTISAALLTNPIAICLPPWFYRCYDSNSFGFDPSGCLSVYLLLKFICLPGSSFGYV